MRLSIVASAMLCTAVLVAAPAWADDGKAADQKFFDGVLRSIGLQGGDDGPGIEYRERAPLVIPPTKTLPPPESTDAASKDPAWPKDPDIIRRKEAAKRERNRNISDEREREQNPLRPDQMTPGGTPTYRPGRDDGFRASPYGAADRMSPSELGYTGGLFNKMFGKDQTEVKRFTGEPTRVDLTSPPSGYQTPSPAQPYGPEKAVPKAVDSYGTHGELQR